MEPEGSLPHSQQPAPPLSRINPVHASANNFLKALLNIIVPSTPRSSKWSLSLRFLHQTPVPYAPLLSPIRATFPAHLIIIDLVNRIIFSEAWRSLTFVLSTPAYSGFLRPKYLPQHSVYRTPQSVCLLQCGIPSSTPVQDEQQPIKWPSKSTD